MAAAPKKQKGKSRTHRKGERPASQRCAGCGEPDDSEVLLRLVVTQEFGVVADPRGRLPGASFHLHPAPECIEKAASGSSHPESQPPQELSAEALRSAMQSFLDNAILSELSRAAASGQVIGGHDKLALALREGSIAWVLVASDAAAGTRRSLERAAGPGLPFHVVDLDRDALGARVGQAPRAALGVPSSRASAVLAKWLRLRWRLEGRTS
jgi:ribosomal protein L7Ae-like RNA K-turn-binding protein